MCKERPKQTATITNESKMILRFIRLTAWTGLLRDKWCIQPATETNGIHVLYVCVCVCVCVWSVVQIITNTYICRNGCCDRDDISSAFPPFYDTTDTHTLTHTQAQTHTLAVIDRWHSPGPTHPIRAARYPPCPRLGPPNLTQGVNNNLNFN